jgi:hypothetical protein
MSEEEEKKRSKFVTTYISKPRSANSENWKLNILD